MPVLLSLAAITGTPAPAQQPTTRPDLRPRQVPIGFGEHGLHHRERMAELQPGMIREGFHWEDVEQKPGVYEFPPHNKDGLEWMVAHRIEPLYILAYNNKLYSGADQKLITDPGQREQALFYWGVHSAENRQAFVEFASFAAHVTRGKARCFEIWNEPDQNGWVPYKAGGDESAEEYAELLKAVYPAIKKVNPEAVVVGGGGITSMRFLEIVLKNAGASMDALSLHPYVHSQKSPEAGGLVDKLSQYRQLVDRYARGKPIWITEFGYHTGRPNPNAAEVTEQMQAQYLVRAALLALSVPGVERFLIYNYQDDNDDPATKGGGWGVLKRDPGGTPKPSFHAIKTLNRMLQGYRFVRASRLEEGFDYTFQKDGLWLRVLWRDGSPGQATVKLDATQVVLTDLWGKSRETQTADGVLQATIGPEVLYVQPSAANND